MMHRLRPYRLVILVALLIGVLPNTAMAQVALQPSCGQIMTGTATSGLDHTPLSSMITACATSSVRFASAYVLKAISDYMVPTVGALFTIAIIFFAISIIQGERYVATKSIGFMIRLAIVGTFSYNMGGGNVVQVNGGWGNAFFVIFDQLLALVSGGVDPFVQIDIIIGRLLGFAPGISLASGMAGVLGGALVSSTVGMFMFGAGLMAILNLLFFILRVIYIYLQAYITIGFLLCLTPLFVPLAIFKSDRINLETYIEAILHKIIAAILIPTFMFAFLSIFLAVFNTQIDGLFAALGSTKCYAAASYGPAACGDGRTTSCPRLSSQEPKVGLSSGVSNPYSLSNVGNVRYCPPDLRPYWKINMPFYSWLTPTDPAFSKKISDTAETGAGAKVKPPVQTTLNPNLRYSADNNKATTPGIDFGPNHVSIVQDLTFTFMTMFIFTALMLSFLSLIPEIVADIAQASIGAIGQGSELEGKAKSMAQGGQGEMQGKMADMKKELSENKKPTIQNISSTVGKYAN
ncbi:MAG: hypothetical protein SFT92_04655 [Rickettsiales bacterium]|nr:hypothetical protein [Rickettsiales bacterium]